jgi:hypothetical protein
MMAPASFNPHRRIGLMSNISPSRRRWFSAAVRLLAATHLIPADATAR